MLLGGHREIRAQVFSGVPNENAPFWTFLDSCSHPCPTWALRPSREQGCLVHMCQSPSPRTTRLTRCYPLALYVLGNMPYGTLHRYLMVGKHARDFSNTDSSRIPPEALLSFPQDLVYSGTVLASPSQTVTKIAGKQESNRHTTTGTGCRGRRGGRGKESRLNLAGQRRECGPSQRVQTCHGPPCVALCSTGLTGSRRLLIRWCPRERRTREGQNVRRDI